MTGPDEHDLPAAIRRDHQAADKLPSSLAARHEVSREYVMNALSLIAPRPAPATDTERRAGSERLDTALTEDAAKSPDPRREVFDLYQELIQGWDESVSYQWVWDHVTAHRPEHGPRQDVPDGGANRARAAGPGRRASPRACPSSSPA
ncbi:hypothetical protein [Streptomyces katsurahamanus]|uniref:Uncharacterized protein n=1 Tax=Streptomyces katsurahamanus TaxID=2577098 RepID=A0ABW9NMN9_9ACTN|nr:hypothetical protein [Streptomyces katsurahamanus]MQS34581.1 hypothetical protein [Streptomyces katsurahamanus]